MNWPVEWDGYEFNPIPRSWIEAPTAVDRNQRAGPRLLAVSAAAKTERELLVRYAHPTNGKVLVEWTPSADGTDGVIPNALTTGSGWARSIRPGRFDPVDDVRAPERDHLRDLWEDEISNTSETSGEVIAGAE